MERSVKELTTSFQDAIVQLTVVIKKLSAMQGALGPQSVDGTELQAALTEFRGRAESFRATCDSLQALIENARHRLLCESLVDEARGIVVPHEDRAPAGGANGGSDAGGNAGEGFEDDAKGSAVVLSALRLEQMSKAVRAIVHDLQHSVAQQRPQELREGPLAGPSPLPAALQPGVGWGRDVTREQAQQHQHQQLASAEDQSGEAKREPGS